MASTPGALAAQPPRRSGSVSAPQRTPAHISQRRTTGTPASRMTRRNRPSASREVTSPVSMPTLHSQSCRIAAAVYRPKRGISQTTTRGTLAKSVRNPAGTVNRSVRPR
jgi:hypothetical protein